SADGLYYSTDFTGATPTYTKDAAFPQYLPICFDQIKSYNQSGEKGRVFIGTLGGGVYTADFSIQVSNKPTKELTKFILYPNPASNNFTLQASSEFNTIKIYDFTGKLVSDKNMPLTNYVTVTQDLKAGIYLIEVKNDTALIGTQKLVITK
ncbi:MAG: T9SS type A sorting domain-containing protein, partial [Bacteroidia bacterium]|nr:T9SS type A sorting domain-containing protein [Bacteroidia bacterium]